MPFFAAIRIFKVGFLAAVISVGEDLTASGWGTVAVATDTGNVLLIIQLTPYLMYIR